MNSIALRCVAVLCPLYYYYQRHPLNYFLLAIFTVSLAFVVGLTCSFTSGNSFCPLYFLLSLTPSLSYGLLQLPLVFEYDV